MGLTYVSASLRNHLNGSRAVKRRLLVDSGAVFSVVPEKILKQLKIKVIDKQEFIFANGETDVRDIGQVEVELFGKTRVVPVVFGEEGVFLLGATTLENFGMMLDPIRREVKPLPMVV